MQDGNTADLIFGIPELIAFISRHITLEPGDVIATGTPAGVGVFRDPPIFLEPGDRVRCEIEGIGSVENPIVDWTDDPRDALTPLRAKDTQVCRLSVGRDHRRSRHVDASARIAAGNVAPVHGEDQPSGVDGSRQTQASLEASGAKGQATRRSGLCQRRP